MVWRGRKHDLYECKDNDCIEDELYTNITRKIRHHYGDVSEQSCFWIRGIVPKCMLNGLEGPSIVEARIWETEGFIETINRSQLGYSDGTG